MAFTVETGVGVAGANSYASLAAALAYHADRRNTAWTDATDPDREAALVRASCALDALFSWPGMRLTEDQGLGWPRVSAYDRDGYYLEGVPSAVIAATCEAALVELAESGAMAKSSESGLKRLKIGQIEKEWAGASGAGATVYPAVYQALSRILKGSQLAIGGR